MSSEIKELFKAYTNKTARTIKKIDSGFNNDNYLINDAYVMRVPKENGDTTISFKNEKTVYDSIEKLNISEKVVNYDVLSGIKITKFCHGTRQYANTLTDEQIFYVARKLKKLHNCKIQVPFFYMMFNKINIYKQNISEDLLINKNYESKIIKEVTKIFAKSPFVLCHNDLVKNNLLFKYDDVFLIDWEYASMNNLYFDLASFISENNLNEKQQELFLSKYFGYRYNDIKRNRVKTFIRFQNILFYYWSLYLYNKRKDKRYLEIRDDKLRRIIEDKKNSD